MDENTSNRSVAKKTKNVAETAVFAYAAIIAFKGLRDLSKDLATWTFDKLSENK